MKKFIVHADSVKIFSEEKDLIKYLSTEKTKKINHNGQFISKLDWVKIETVEINVLETSNASQYLESYIESQKREIKLSSVLGDEIYQNFENFKSMFLEFAKDDINKKRFLSQLETIEIEKKSLSKLISGWAGYLILLNDSVEWFKILLKFHNFRKINDSYVTEIFYSNGTSRYVNMKVTEESKKNFQIAKA